MIINNNNNNMIINNNYNNMIINNNYYYNNMSIDNNNSNQACWEKLHSPGAEFFDERTLGETDAIAAAACHRRRRRNGVGSGGFRDWEGFCSDGDEPLDFCKPNRNSLLTQKQKQILLVLVKGLLRITFESSRSLVNASFLPVVDLALFVFQALNIYVQ